MKIALLKKEELSPEIEQQINDLFKQLAPDRKQISLHEIFKDKNDISFAYASEGATILGIASMCVYSVISGNKGMIEDVVVHETARGQGLGRKLMNTLISVAKKKELTEILLFSSEHRVAAKKLYEDLGFIMNASKLYKLPL